MSFLRDFDNASNEVTKFKVEQSNFAAIDIERLYHQHQKLTLERNKLKMQLANPAQDKAMHIMTTKCTLNQAESQEAESEDTEDDINDSNLTDFYQNNPMSMDGILSRVFYQFMPQILAVLLERMTLIINVFFISLSGYYGIE